MQDREFTFRAVFLGLILSVVLGAANTYLGLYAGLTVSASIPAAVISMFILRKVLRSGSILENNIVQSMASAGESLAAGVIFTIPALIISRNWHDFAFWPTTLVAFSGGMLGILFLIPFRKPFISTDQQRPELKQDLIYPEGEACALVLKTGDQSGQATSIFSGMTVGILFKFITSLLVKSSAYFVLPLSGSGRRVGYMGLDFSVALAGVGFIVGLRIAAMVFAGGLITWMFILPLFGPINPATSLEPQVFSFWSAHGRFAGVGAMLIGTVESLLLASSVLRTFSLNSLKDKLKSLFDGSSPAAEAKTVAPMSETERDLPPWLVAGLILFTSIVAGSLIVNMNGWLALPLIFWILILSFPVVAVAAYLVGLVGSSNSPVSGITLTVLLLTGILLLPFLDGKEGVLAMLLVAGMICCAAATSGDIAQDLRTGSLVGARPYRQQLAEILGVAVSAPFFALVLQLLHETYGIGDQGLLKAPQATLFASLAESMFSDAPLPVFMISVGALLGALLFFWNRYGLYRIPIMPVAVGMYLPLSVSSPLLLGGILFYAHRRWSSGSRTEDSISQSKSEATAALDSIVASPLESENNENSDLNRAKAGSDSPASETEGGWKSTLNRWVGDPLLYSSGLIAGEALGGIMLALWILYAGGSTGGSSYFIGLVIFLIVLLPMSPVLSRFTRRS